MGWLLTFYVPFMVYFQLSQPPLRTFLSPDSPCYSKCSCNELSKNLLHCTCLKGTCTFLILSFWFSSEKNPQSHTTTSPCQIAKRCCFSSEPFSTPFHFWLFQCIIFLHADGGLSGIIFPPPSDFSSLLAGSAIFRAPHSPANWPASSFFSGVNLRMSVLPSTPCHSCLFVCFSLSLFLLGLLSSALSSFHYRATFSCCFGVNDLAHLLHNLYYHLSSLYLCCLAATSFLCCFFATENQTKAKKTKKAQTNQKNP